MYETDDDVLATPTWTGGSAVAALSVQVDAIVFIQIIDAANAVYRVDNLMYAIGQLAPANWATKKPTVGTSGQPQPSFRSSRMNIDS